MVCDFLNRFYLFLVILNCEFYAQIRMAVGKPFQKGNTGKPKGAVNKTTRLVKDVFAQVFDDLQKDKKANLLQWAKENPTEFYKLSSKLIPIQLTGQDGKSIAFQITYNYQPGNKPLANEC